MPINKGIGCAYFQTHFIFQEYSFKTESYERFSSESTDAYMNKTTKEFNERKFRSEGKIGEVS